MSPTSDCFCFCFGLHTFFFAHTCFIEFICQQKRYRRKGVARRFGSPELFTSQSHQSHRGLQTSSENKAGENPKILAAKSAKSHMIPTFSLAERITMQIDPRSNKFCLASTGSRSIWSPSSARSLQASQPKVVNSRVSPASLRYDTASLR